MVLNLNTNKKKSKKGRGNVAWIPAMLVILGQQLQSIRYTVISHKLVILVKRVEYLNISVFFCVRGLLENHSMRVRCKVTIDTPAILNIKVIE